jgi:hypothetical protein
MEENVHTFGETAETVFIWVFGPLLKLLDVLFRLTAWLRG